MDGCVHCKRIEPRNNNWAKTTTYKCYLVNQRDVPGLVVLYGIEGFPTILKLAANKKHEEITDAIQFS